MKKWGGVFAIAVLVIFTIGCQDDDFGLIEDDDTLIIRPHINFLDFNPLDNTPFINSNATIAPGSIIPLGFEAKRGSAPLKSLSISMDGVLLSTQSFNLFDLINGTSPLTLNNPISLHADFQDELTWKMLLSVHSDISSRDYTIGIEDENNILEVVNIRITTVGPEISLLSVDPIDNSLYFDTDFTTYSNSIISMGVKIISNSTNLNTLSIYEDDSLLQTNRFNFFDLNDLNSPIPTQNPLHLSSSFSQGLTWKLLLKVQGGISTKNYTIVVTDENNQSSSISIEISTLPPPVEWHSEVTLLNSAGPAGGLNLDNGETTGPFHSSAHIRDMGIDLTQPSSSNWRRQISGVNGSVIRTPDFSFLPSGFNISDVNTKDDIENLFATGITLPNDNGTVSAIITVGDLFVIQNGSRIYLLEAKEVNETTNNNADNYVFELKY